MPGTARPFGDSLKTVAPTVDIDGAMRRLLVSIAALLALSASAAFAADSPPPPPPPPSESPAGSQQGTTPSTVSSSGPASGARSWAKAQIKVVIAAGLMAPSIAEFRPNDPLTKGELAELLGALGGTAAPAAASSQPVKLRELDAALVRLLGLGPEAATLRQTLISAGLEPPGRVGTEAVARLLGLRTNHPQAQDGLELEPGDPITRAEAAYSVARVLELRASGGGAEIGGGVTSLVLPELTNWQRRVLSRAVRFVGYPYVWGGSSEKAQAPFGKRMPGGFDCSGFVWRVYKLEPYDGAPSLSDTLQGRTTYEMSGEVTPDLRIPFGRLQPGDVLFFGDRGPDSKPAQVGHMGIFLGGGWFVHSSSRGVTIAPLAGWYSDTFAWARRPLAEAGLAPH